MAISQGTTAIKHLPTEIMKTVPHDLKVNREIDAGLTTIGIEIETTEETKERHPVQVIRIRNHNKKGRLFKRPLFI